MGWATIDKKRAGEMKSEESMYILSIFLQKQNWIASYKLCNRLLSFVICSVLKTSSWHRGKSRIKSLVADAGSVMLLWPLTVYQRIRARPSDHCSVVNQHGKKPPSSFHLPCQPYTCISWVQQTPSSVSMWIKLLFHCLLKAISFIKNF